MPTRIDSRSGSFNPYDRMMERTNHPSEVWYSDGLQFTCTRCGACCTGEEGFVWLDDVEIAALAQRLQQSESDFCSTYTRRVRGKVSLKEKPGGDCIFWSKTKGCTVYEDRPRQCRTWPFWDSNLATPEDWEETTRICPGAGSGRLFTVEEIVEQAKQIKL